MSHFNVAVFTRHGTEEEIAELLAPYEEQFGKDQIYATEFKADEDSDEVNDETGEHGYWRNPNAKWDFWSVGGRWRGLLKLIPGARTGRYSEFRDWTQEGRTDREGHCDYAKVRDCNLAMNSEVYERALRFWDIYVEQEDCSEEEYKRLVPSFCWSREYYKERFGNKQTYAVHEAAFITYAFVTPDGEWHSEGDMGWWGCDNATNNSLRLYSNQLQEFLMKAVEDDLWITIVDCHI